MVVKSDLCFGLFWRVSVGTVVMLAFGYVVGFTISMAAWAFILYDIFVDVLVPLLGVRHYHSWAHYFYMREHWVTIKQNPIVYRYIDWSWTVPLLMIELHCIHELVKSYLCSGLL